MRGWLGLMVGLVALAGTAWGQGRAMQTLDVQGQQRIFAMERVGEPGGAARVPIVIVLHGADTLVADGLPSRADIPFTRVPGFGPALVVWPQGVDRRWDASAPGQPTWPRPAGADGVRADDVAFLRALIGRMVATENGDPARVFVAGVSSGGFMAARVACAMADAVAGVADVMATASMAVLQACAGPPAPFALIASTTDDVVAYAGRRGQGASAIASAPETAFFFARRNGCTGLVQTEVPHQGLEDESTATLVRFSGCQAPVVFYRVDGSRHAVPSTAPMAGEDPQASGSRNRDFDTATVLWSFFHGLRQQ